MIHNYTFFIKSFDSITLTKNEKKNFFKLLNALLQNMYSRPQSIRIQLIRNFG